ncbi:hypothetical protein B0T25DRAFT_278724 [Lasiosphaeria hispida]|uniref:Uncharacterized protein n=1 Tax=Lasiosphaeria hispida TaxID=260671 RepID=A0AAJ0MAP9_9PEZI|nr:hypothetical protein B0T25DRAFT_278724 [Lasiosphaeria hispida]
MALGINHTLSDHGRLLQLVEEVGFRPVKEQSRRIPIGKWASVQGLKEAGLSMLCILYIGAQYIAGVPLTKGLGWSDDPVRELVKRFRQGLRNPVFDFSNGV